METLLSVCVGIALAAACGFRIFVPLLVAGLAARTGHLTLSAGTSWMATDAALVALGTACVLEITAYYVPWLDHLLDAAGAPVAVTAGILVASSVFTGMDPWLRWSLAAVAGGGAAGTMQALTSGTRLVSAVKTFGLGNPFVATAEAAGAATLSVLAVFLPVLAAAAALALLAAAWWLARRIVRPA